MTYIEIFINSFEGITSWVWQLVTCQVAWSQNYFYGLILLSGVIWVVELMFPWRKNQPKIRKDFFLDGFYIFFNFFIFTIGISGFYGVFEMLILSTTHLSMTSFSILNISHLPVSFALLIFFILSDFVQWLTHIMLHQFSFLWQFHKVHHSVMQMGFAAHLRYHWMENILYKPLKTLVVMILGGFEPQQAFIVHFVSIAIGHLNHANIKLTYGPLKYVFNNPVMHLWHHAKRLPAGKKSGVNFGISLSLWDYVFRTNYVPDADGETELGFEGIEKFPKDFIKQSIYGFNKTE